MLLWLDCLKRSELNKLSWFWHLSSFECLIGLSFESFWILINCLLLLSFPDADTCTVCVWDTISLIGIEYGWMFIFEFKLFSSEWIMLLFRKLLPLLSMFLSCCISCSGSLSWLRSLRSSSLFSFSEKDDSLSRKSALLIFSSFVTL